MSDLRLGAISHATDIIHIELEGEHADMSIQAIYGIDANHRFYATGRGWYSRQPEEITNLMMPDISYYGLYDVLPTTFPWLAPLLHFHGRDAITGVPQDVMARSWQTFIDEYRPGLSRDMSSPRSQALTPHEHLAHYLQCPPEYLADIPHPEAAAEHDILAAIEPVIDALKPAWRQHAASLVALYRL